MGNEKRCSGIGCVLSFLTGTVIGGGVGLLTAMKLRKARDAKEKAKDYYDEMEHKPAEATDKADNEIPWGHQALP